MEVLLHEIETFFVTRRKGIGSNPFRRYAKFVKRNAGVGAVNELLSSVRSMGNIENKNKAATLLRINMKSEHSVHQVVYRTVSRRHLWNNVGMDLCEVDY